MRTDARPAARLLDGFARRTGLDGDASPDRYLWTDALAVCVDLTLHRETGDPGHLERARRLVDQVHRVLGRHRPDDPRQGWISGLPEEEGLRRPTAGGLRIGKPQPERAPGEPLDPQREWDRDGQYYHYLTRWMHALSRMARATGDPTYLEWAVELARAAHEGFVRPGRAGRPATMVWKASIELDRALVPSMGQLDPLDGYVTLRCLSARWAERDDGTPEIDPPTREEAELAELCRGRSWVTDDPLGLGGLLSAAWRSARVDGPGTGGDRPVAPGALLDDAVRGLGAFGARFRPDGPVGGRLPFRELGLVLGIHALEKTADSFPAALGDRVPGRPGWRALAQRIQAVWLDPESRTQPTWTGHEEINTVTLAATLAPTDALDP